MNIRKNLKMKKPIEVSVYSEWIVIGNALETIQVGDICELNPANGQIRKALPPPPAFKPLVGVKPNGKKKKSRKG